MTKRTSRALILPVAALALTGLAACATNEYPSDSPGTTPAVVTGNVVPANGPVGASGDTGSTAGTSSNSATAALKKADGSSAGTATFTEQDGVAVVDVKVTGLTAGFHGMDIHTVGKCEANSTAPAGGAAGDFLSAGGHFQPTGRKPASASGQLVSIYVNSNGTGQTVTTTGAFTVDDLLGAAQGTSLVVTTGADNAGDVPAAKTVTPGQLDQTGVDTTDAGARVACGVIKAG